MLSFVCCVYLEGDDSFDALIFNLFENSERRKEETKYPFPAVNYARKKLDREKGRKSSLVTHFKHLVFSR